jgi:hypothetical protein
METVWDEPWSSTAMSEHYLCILHVISSWHWVMVCEVDTDMLVT